jgi:glycosyltransferase involved in cell wall biosynthesis
VLHVFGRLERSGAELRTIELAESLERDRVISDFLVLTGLDGSLDQRVRNAGGDVIKCPLDRRFPLSLYRLLRARRYDVVHSHVHYFSGVILAIARAARTPCRVAHFRTAVVNDKQDTRRRRIQLAVCRRLVDLMATDILAVGEGAMGGAWAPGWRSDRRCRVIYNGIPSRRLGLTVSRDSAPPTIVNVASLQPLKNQLRLIEILRQCVRDLPDLRLCLVGRDCGDYGGKVLQASKDAGLSGRVHLIGEVDDPMPNIAAARLMIVPSLWEGLPGAALEACALGIPVLASDLPGTRELASHFPHMRTMSLDESDEAWAAAAVGLIRQGVSSGADAVRCLANSPFTMARTRESYLAVWSRARASA